MGRRPPGVGEWLAQLVFPGVWLVYLLQTASGVQKHTSGVWPAVGLILVVVFCCCYLRALPAAWGRNDRRFWTNYLALYVICFLELFLAHDDALVMMTFIAVLAMSRMRRHSAIVVTSLAALTVIVPNSVPSWRHHVDYSIAFSVVMVSLAMYGFFTILQSNRELTAARTEVARLAAENERSRIARDLHDLLGHSLTTITVKAGLAKRLVERDPARAAQEIGEVEELTRSTLADVRAAVSGYREITLAGELATSQEVLRASGISATSPAQSTRSPGSTRAVRLGGAGGRHQRDPPRARDLHDQGRPELARDRRRRRGRHSGCGTGLPGLRERVAAAGGTVTAGGGARDRRMDAAGGPAGLARAARIDVGDPIECAGR